MVERVSVWEGFLLPGGERSEEGLCPFPEIVSTFG